MKTRRILAALLAYIYIYIRLQQYRMHGHYRTQQALILNQSRLKHSQLAYPLEL